MTANAKDVNSAANGQAPVAVTRDGAVMEIRFDRPDKKNALTFAMYDAASDALDQAAADPQVRVVVLTGSGDAFTAGNDLDDFLRSPGFDDTRPAPRFIATAAAFPKPLIGAVNGLAIGVGVTILLHCDLVFAADNAVFRMPFVDLGLTPEAASSQLLPALIGHRRASALLLLGESFSAETARDYGIVNAVTRADDLREQARAAARALAAKAPAAVRATKALMRAPAEPTPARLTREGKLFAERLASPELAEAVRAFKEKRPPDFSEFS